MFKFIYTEVVTPVNEVNTPVRYSLNMLIWQNQILNDIQFVEALKLIVRKA